MAKEYSGLITRLVETEILSQYLRPLSTQHTFISLQTNHGANLKLLAESCGNSIDVIIKHYLKTDNEQVLIDI